VCKAKSNCFVAALAGECFNLLPLQFCARASRASVQIPNIPKEHPMTLIATPAVAAEPSLSLDFDVHPVGSRIGAEIRGVRLGPDLDDSTISAINAALLLHKVIFFRGQSHLDDTAQEAFASRFGETVAHPTVPSVAGSSHLLELDSKSGTRANSWHTDVTFVAAYPKISILRGVVIPPAGGDTVWANTSLRPTNASRTRYAPLRTPCGPFIRIPTTMRPTAAHPLPTPNLRIANSSRRRSMKPSIRSCEYIPKRANGVSCWVISCSVSSACRNAIRTG
jgi:hypothetical protein